MSQTVGTVDIAVKLNTAGFEQQVQQAVNYTTKAFNSIDISKAFQNQFKQATSVVQQVSQTMSNSVRSAVSGITVEANSEIKAVQQKIKETEKMIAAQERALLAIEKDAKKKNPKAPEEILDNSYRYQTILGSLDSSHYALNQQKQELEILKQKLAAQKQLDSAVSKTNQTNSLINSITSQKQYNDLLEKAKGKMALIESEAQKISEKTGFSINQIVNQNAEYQKQAGIVDTLESNVERIKNNILQTNIANQSQSSIWEQVKTSIDAVKNATSETGEKVRSISIDNFSNVLGAAGSKLTAMGGTAGKLGTVFTGVAGTLSKFNPYILAAGVALKTVWNTATKLRDVVNETFDKIKDVASNIGSKISSAIQGITNQSSSFENAWGGALNRLIVLMGSLFSINKMYGFFKESITAAGDMESAWYGLATMAIHTGNSFENAQNFITQYTKDGLVTISDAVTAYKTLISAKYTEQQTQDIMNAFKDTAAFGRQAGKTISQAVKEASEGVKNQNSVMTDNAGITKNLSVMYKEYAASIGTTEGKLTEAQKRMAIYEGMLHEAKLSHGNAARAADTFNGKLSKLGATFYNLKIAIGNVFLPVLNLIIPVLNSILLALTRFFNGVANLLSLIGLEVPNVETILSNVTGSMSSVGGAASDTAEDIAGTGDAAKKAAKDINKAFANVDEIHVLDFNKTKGSGSGAGGAGAGYGGTDLGELTDTKNQLAGLDGEINEALRNSLKEKARILAEGINAALDGIDWETIKTKAHNIALNITTFLNDFIKWLDWNLIGYTIAEGLNTALVFANTLLSTFNFFEFGASIANGLSSMIRSIDWTLLGETIGNYFNSTIHTIEGFVTNFKWIELGIRLTDGLKSAFSTVDWGTLVYDVYTGMNGVLSTIYTVITDINWANFGLEIANKLNKLIKGIDWTSLGKTVGELWNAVWDTLWEFVDNFDFEGLVDDIIHSLNTFIETADITKAGKTVGTVLEKILTTGTKLLNEVDWKKVIEDFLDGVDLVQIMIDYYTLKNAIWWAKFSVIAELIMDAIWDGFEKIFIDPAKDFGQFLWDHMVQPWIDTADSIKDDAGLLEIGGNIVKGVLKGITGVFTSPFQLMKEYIFDPIWEGICLAFGIESPAKEMEPIGKYIVEGIFKGITNLKDKAIKKWNEIKGWFTDPEVGLKAKWETTKQDVTTWWNNTKSWFTNTTDKATVKVKSSYETAKSTVTSWWNNTKSWFINTSDKATFKVKSAYATTKSNVTTWWNNTKSWFTGTTDKATFKVKSAFETTKSTVTSWWSKVKGWWGDRTLTISAKISDVTANIKDWINSNFIDRVNSKLPSWFGKIPRLATGGYVEANNPQLAIVGDNKREGEIITPESKIYEQVSKALKENSNGSTQKQELEITIVHKYESGKQIIQKINSEQIKQGKILLLT